MSTFKPGDRIICINDEQEGDEPGFIDLGPLTKGTVYTVKEVNLSGFLNLREISAIYWYRENRFDLDSRFSSPETEQKIRDLEHTVSQQKATNNRQQQEITALQRDNATKQDWIRARNDEISNLKGRVTAVETKLDALVTHLHVFADNLEDAGDDQYAKEIDELLSELHLKSRKTKFEIIFTAPMQYRVEGWWRTEAEARSAFNEGLVEWNEGDYEQVADGEDPTIKVVARMEDQ